MERYVLLLKKEKEVTFDRDVMVGQNDLLGSDQ
jgi:hypothetical protein